MAKKKGMMWGPLVVATAAVATGLYLSRPAWQDYQREDQKSAARIRDAHEQEQKLADRLQEESETQTAVGREALVRQQGQLKKGELPLPLPASDRR
jgi:cytochrome c-type biogenesis protein CcmH/NrfG